MPAISDHDPRPVSLDIQGINHAFGTGESRKQVLFDNSLKMHEGEVVIMSGPSGSGKTTLLTLIGALRTIQDGEITALGTSLSRLKPREQVLMRRQIGFIFQAHNLFESLTARQNVRMALELSGIPSRQWNRVADDILSDLGMGERLHYKPRKLSGGQRQRVAIARALVNRPRLILADEPTAALDKEMGGIVLQKLKSLAREAGSTIVIVTHDARIIAAADRIVNMVDGRIAGDYDVKRTLFICNFIKESEAFKGMSIDDLTNVAQKMKVEHHPKGHVLFREGDSGDRFYLIHKGAVEVVRDEKNQERIIGTLGPQECFGEVALLKEQPRNATIRVTEDSEFFSLGKQDFLDAVASHRPFSDQLSHTLLNRM
jgi:putative ABC transport system ATP-binding protein